MGSESKIEWVRGEDGAPGATWNPVVADANGKRGWFCIKQSAGCAHCYAASFNKVYGNGLDYTVPNREKAILRLDWKKLTDPLRWKQPRKVFVCSMSDLFLRELYADFIVANVFGLMALSNHTFICLTKDAERMYECLTAEPFKSEVYAAARNIAMRWNQEHTRARDLVGIVPQFDMKWPLPNVWLGVTAENQETANRRIPFLLDTPAAVRWVSAEPLLGTMDLRQWLRRPMRIPPTMSGDGPEEYGAKLDWVVVGGESGPKARPMHPEWARSLRDQCHAAGVPFFFKQWGEHSPVGNHDKSGKLTDFVGMERVGKKAAGRLLDGREWSEYPEARS